MTTRYERVYSDAEITERLTGDLARWSHADGALVRVYRTKDWRATLLAAGAVAHLAEAAWHHPELVLNYPSLEVRLNTHSASGVTDKDFGLSSAGGRRAGRWKERRRMSDISCRIEALD